MRHIKINARKGTQLRKVIDTAIEIYGLELKQSDNESIYFGFGDISQFHKVFYVDTIFMGGIHYYESDKILVFEIDKNSKAIYQISIMK